MNAKERGEGSCLMNLVDDATGITLAVMSEEETTVSFPLPLMGEG